MVNIRQNLVDGKKWGIKCPYKMEPKFVVIHNTANDAPAENEIAYMRRNDNEVSFHYAVDDKEVVQGVLENRNAWHAGDGGKGEGNRYGIAIEICYSKSGGEKFEKAEKNAAEFAASILKRYGWGIDRLKKHQDFNGKYCPHRTLDLGWDRFVDMVKGFLDGMEPEAPVDELNEVKTDMFLNKNVKGQIIDIGLKVDHGEIWYQVHTLNGKWLPKVTGYDPNDFINGYAGNHTPIDAIRVYYTTPEGEPYKQARYAVQTEKSGTRWLPEQVDDYTTNGMDGYAGNLGEAITDFKWRVDNE